MIALFPPTLTDNTRKPQVADSVLRVAAIKPLSCLLAQRRTVHEEKPARCWDRSHERNGHLGLSVPCW